MTKILLEITEEQKTGLKIIAKNDDMSVNQLIRKIIREHLEKNKQFILDLK